MIEIDGSYGEGGGQILRTALALATVLHKTVRVSKIRQGRPVPGMKAQHLIGAQAVATISGASVQGLVEGSTELTFEPGVLKSGNFQFNVGTAGSITLVLQTLMPVLPFLPGESRIEITGGTDVKWSPPIDYLQLVTLPLLQYMGYNAKMTVQQRGHYPKGGGKVTLETIPSRQLTSITGEESQSIRTVTGVSHVTNLPGHIASRQAEVVKQVVIRNDLPEPNIRVEIDDKSLALGVGSGIVLVARGDSNAILGADSLGERGVPAEKVGTFAGQQLVNETSSNKYLDSHMGDIIIPYLVLAKGSSHVTVSKVTQHLITNVKVAELLTDVSFGPYGELGGPGILQVEGLAWTHDEANAATLTKPVAYARE